MLAPRYIGDGVYVQVDPNDQWRIIVTTGSHILADADNVVYLEGDQMKGLNQFIHDFNE